MHVYTGMCIYNLIYHWCTFTYVWISIIYVSVIQPSMGIPEMSSGSAACLVFHWNHQDLSGVGTFIGAIDFGSHWFLFRCLCWSFHVGLVYGPNVCPHRSPSTHEWVKILHSPSVLDDDPMYLGSNISLTWIVRPYWDDSSLNHSSNKAAVRSLQFIQMSRTSKEHNTPPLRPEIPAISQQEDFFTASMSINFP